MLNHFVKVSVFIFLTVLFPFVQAQEVKPALPCVSAVELNELAKNFSQFQTFLEQQKSEYCEADLGMQWLHIANSLVTLKNAKPNEPMMDQEDAFTHKAIDEKNWWEYFVKRAKIFTIEETCPANAVAFVVPFFMDSNIHICAPFFESNVTSQASVMMHEVRHFDGFPHFTCERGLDKGASGGCDSNILDKGSYAITVQTLVAMAKSEQFEKSERDLLESEAIFTMYNRFNVVPKVKIVNEVFLSNTAGEVYKWVVGKGIELVSVLAQPARVFVSYSSLTIYPTDSTLPAYRKDQELKADVASIGLFANKYNSDSVEERSKYDSVSYIGQSGLLKNNSLFAICDSANPLTKDLTPSGDFVRVISLSDDEVDSNRQALLLDKNGDLVAYKCADNNVNDLVISSTGLKVSADLINRLVDSFGISGKIYGLLQDGSLTELQNNESTIVEIKSSFPFENKNWVSASPMSNPEIFN